MKIAWFQTPAFVLPFALALLSCSSSAQTAINVGKCQDYDWQNDCTAASSPTCPSSGHGPCMMVIRDRGGVAIAAQQGSSASNYICVERDTMIQWMEGTATNSFVVDFGTSTPFTNSKAVFTGKPGTNDSGSIVHDPSTVPECNEYVILHCGTAKCTMGDPIVVVHGGQMRFDSPNDHQEKR